MWQRDPQEAEQGLQDLRRLTRGALAEMRTMLLELRPVALVKTPLGDLLKQLVEATTSRTDLKGQADLDSCPTLPTDVHVNFYRVAQEALNNVVKHAGADQINVDLQATPPFALDLADSWQGQVKLIIEDDGRGFNPNHTTPGHLGLGIMRERAEAIGAELTIEGQLGQGTTVTLIWQND